MKAAQAAGLPRLFELETEYEEQQLISELKFVNGLVEEISSGTLEGLDTGESPHRGLQLRGGALHLRHRT